MFGNPGGTGLLYGGTTGNTPIVNPFDNVSYIIPTVSTISNNLSSVISVVIVSGLLKLGITFAVLLTS